MKPSISFPLTLVTTTLAIFTFLFSCKSKETKTEPPTRTSVFDEAEVQKNTPETEEFLNPKEGFLNSSTFQVVVSSLKSNPKEAEQEALKVATKKAFQVLLTEAKSNLSSEGKGELQEISQSGRILKSSPNLQGKFYFLYQIQKQGLESLVKTRIK